jgi:hypothetical protein
LTTASPTISQQPVGSLEHYDPICDDWNNAEDVTLPINTFGAGTAWRRSLSTAGVSPDIRAGQAVRSSA